MTKQLVYLSLGGNEGDTLTRLQNAMLLLCQHDEVHSFRASHFYRTPPFQAECIEWFINCVCCFLTSFTLNALFAFTQHIEKSLGKVPKPKVATRPIDIDLLFYGSQTYRDQTLEIPHSKWKERLFVLIPLADLTQEISIQAAGTVENYQIQELIQSIPQSQFLKIYT